MPGNSGTPVDWIRSLSPRLVHVRCVCPPDVAASRFAQRQRHYGHLDGEVSEADLLERLRALAQLPPPDLGRRIDVDTSVEPDLADVVRAIRGALDE